MAGPKTPVVAVLSVGEDALALAAVDRDLAVVAKRTAPNPPLAGAAYPAIDTAHVWRWFMAALGDLAELFRVEALVPTAFGTTAALVDDSELALAMMRPDAEPPAAVRAAFEAVAPAPVQAGLATPAIGTSLGLQLFWQQEAFAAAFARARWILGHAAYWGFRLTSGVAASDTASLVEGGQLAEVVGGRPTTLARRRGWQLLLPARRDPHRLLGRLGADAADCCGLPRETEVLVGTTPRAAAHALLLAAGFDRAAVVTVDGRRAEVTTPGATAVTAERRLLASADGRTLSRTHTAPSAEAVAEALDAAGCAGPVLVVGEWRGASGLAGLRAARGQGVLLVEDADLWAKGGALLARWGRRPPPVKLALTRLAESDCAASGETA